MHNYYEDILSRIPDAPLWFDEAGVPRYVQFSPLLAWNIYADEAVLMEIECQGCARSFVVCMTWARNAPLTLAQAVRQRNIQYGDPPNIRCCDAGPSMTSVAKRVLEFWHCGRVAYDAAMAALPLPPQSPDEQPAFEKAFRSIYDALDPIVVRGWDRIPELEVDVMPDWAKGPRG